MKRLVIVASEQKSSKNTRRRGLILFFVVALLAGGVCLSSCGDGDYEVLFPEGTWEDVSVQGNDSLTITLENYPQEQKFYANVYNTGGFRSSILFQDNLWYGYRIKQDTIFIKISDIELPWVMQMSSDKKTLRLNHAWLNIWQDLTTLDYTFIRQN